MFSPPFHRRILPWIFAITFIAAAPAVVFYTAGYRWNTKKEKVERNGTLIINTRPTGALIFLNGDLTKETSPSTIQSVSPGRIELKLTKTGYHDWDKHLDVLPQFVTFANDIRLWKNAEPSLTPGVPATRIETSPNDKQLAVLSDADRGSVVRVWSPTNTPISFALADRLSSAAIMTWSDDSRAILIEDPSSPTSSVWMIPLRSNGEPTRLAHGTYRWDGSRLNGVTDTDFVEIQTTDGAITRTPLADGLVDSFSGVALKRATDADSLVLYRDTDPKRGLILPSGNWRIARLQKNIVLLRDRTSWLSVDPTADAPQFIRANGDLLRPLTVKRITTYLLVNGGELWNWNPTADPELLSREGDAVNDAVWHDAGSDIAFTSVGSVAMLNLDPRDGRMRTILASFDMTTDVAILGKSLYIAGTKNGQTGLWSLEIE